MGDISDKLGFAPDYLSHLFKKYHGESPVRYLTGLRINYAKQLLIRQPDLEVAVIGEMSGYRTRSISVRYLRKIRGCGRASTGRKGLPETGVKN